MAISIHHGSNGSYKTAGVVQDYLIPAMSEGRIVVTNIRGISRDKCFDVFSDTHPDFDVIYVDGDTIEGRKKIARFWHWAPIGALLLFDEAGVLFPKRWRQKDLDELDFLEGEALGRPINWVEAWEMHRHYNWDIVLSCPNIKSLRMDIRDTSEGAFKHRNNKMIGFAGSYNEGFHRAEDNGSSPSQFLSVRKKKIKQTTFQLYESTRTGTTQGSSAGTSIFYNANLMVGLVLLTLTFGYSSYNWLFNNPFDYEDKEVIPTVKESIPVPSSPSVLPVVRVSSGRINPVEVNPNFHLEPFANHTFKILYSMMTDSRSIYMFRLFGDSGYFDVSSKELKRAGYSVISISLCSATVVFKAKRYNAICNAQKLTSKKLSA